MTSVTGNTMKDVKDKFIKWARPTLKFWVEVPSIFEYNEELDEFEDTNIHLMYIAYRAGYNRAKKEVKDDNTNFHAS